MPSDESIPPFGITIDRQGDCDRLVVVGEIDIATADDFQRAIVSCDPGHNVIVDLSAVAFLDSSGVRALVQASRARQAQGLAVHIVSPSSDGRIRRAIDLLQVNQVVPVHDDVEEAAQEADC